MSTLLERETVDASPAAPARTGTRGLGSRWRASLRLARRQTLRAWASSLLVIALIALPMAFVAGVLVYADGRQPTTAERIDAELGAAAAWVAVVNGPDPSLTQYDDQPLSIEIDRNPRTGEPTHEQQPLPGSAAPSLAGRDAIEIGVGSATVRTASGIAPVRAVIGDASADVLRGRFLLREGRAAAGPREAMVSPGALERLGVAIGDTVTLTEPEGSYTISGVLSRAEDTDAAVTIFLPATAQTRALQTDVQQMRWYLPTWHPARSDISRLNAAENDRASELP